jgi:hypothetical protein
MNELANLLKSGQEDNFCPEMFGEWFVKGELDDSHFINLTGEQCDEVYESIDERWGEAMAQKFDDKALPLIKMQ